MRFRFRTVLVAGMLGLLLTTIAIVAATSFLAARDAAHVLSEHVLALAAERTEDGARRLLGIASSQAELDGARLSSGRVDPYDHEAVAAYFVDAIHAHPELSSLSWTRADTGELVQVERDRAGRLTAVYQHQLENGHRIEPFAVEGTERKALPPRTDHRPTDPRTQAYYTAAQRLGAPTWTETYQFVGNDGSETAVGMTRATPVKGPDGAFRGVLSADFDLFALSEFVRGLKVGEHGMAFVIELRADGTRRVIAVPEAALLTTVAGKPLPADDIADPRVHAFLPAFDASVRGAAPGRLIDVDFEAGGARYLGGYRLLQGDRGLRWAVALALPEAEILGPVERSRRTTVLITLGATCFAVLLAVLFGMRFGNILRALTRETEAVGRFHLEPQALVDSSVVEVRQLSSAIEDMKRGLRSFRKFVPADLVRRLVQSGDEAMQGGKRQTITVHFSDIAGFTSFSEKLSPEALVELLCEYLTLVSADIVGSGGTLDKYIGDAVMAFWNAPSPVDDHAFIACKVALDNRRRVAALRADWTARGRPAIACRVGLHTGDAIVGNVGSDARLDFTAIGDTVNIASRLEGLGKFYGVDVIVSEATLARVEGRVLARPLDRVAVKGREGSLLIYELVALTDEATDAQRADVERHGRALDAYFARRWDEALALLGEAPGDDVAAAMLVARIHELALDPPTEGWDGVHHMTRK